MPPSERIDQDRRRDAAARELGRLRAADDREPEAEEETDLVDTVTDEQQRVREASDEDPPY